MEYTGRNTIYDYLREEDIPDGIHSMTLANGEIIDFEIVNYLEDKTFDTNELLGDDVPDTKMLILKFHKNCIINKDVVVTPQVRKKGFTLFVTNSLVNDGIISMTARGAIAEGQEVIIYGYEGAYDIIPKEGGQGGAKTGGVTGTVEGNRGSDGVNRGTGGGGAGGFIGNHTGYYSGAGSSGTSYSGGTGGGGNAFNDDPANAQDGEPNGGAGGLSFCRRTTANGWNATGGVGNPAGMDSWRNSGAGYGSHVTKVSDDGTGGLLIVYTSVLQNTGTIESNGSNSKLLPNNPSQCATGGASGGGSVNIYADMCTVMTGNITAYGGTTPNGETSVEKGIRGGDGGNGSVSISTIEAQTTNKLMQEDKVEFILMKMCRVIRALFNSVGDNISSVEEQLSSLASATYWEDSVETIDDLPVATREGETHYVEAISSYARWNGTKWVFISANIISKVSETVDGILSKEDYTLFKNSLEKSTLTSNSSEIYEELEVKQLYNLVGGVVSNFYPKTITSAVINEEGTSLKSLLENVHNNIQQSETNGKLSLGDREIKVYDDSDIKDRLDQLGNGLSDGMIQVASAITDKGVLTKATDGFSTMASNIRKISSSNDNDTARFISHGNLDSLPYIFYDGCAVMYNNEIHILGCSYRHSRLDSKTNKWVSDVSIPYVFHNGCAVVYKDEIHILGGYRYTSADGWVKTKNHYKLNKTSNIWEVVSELPYEFVDGCAVVYKGEIHIFGGDYKYHYTYNGTSWVKVSTLTYYIKNGCAVVYNDEIHAFGFDTKYHYKFNGTSWSKVSNLPYTDTLNSMSAFVMNNTMYILGGYSESNKTKFYSYSSSVWTSVYTLPMNCRSLCTINDGKRVHALGNAEGSNMNQDYVLNDLLIYKGDDSNLVINDGKCTKLVEGDTSYYQFIGKLGISFVS